MDLMFLVALVILVFLIILVIFGGSSGKTYTGV